MLGHRPAVFFGGLLLLLFGPLLQECQGDLALFSGFPTVIVVNGSQRPAAVGIQTAGGSLSRTLQPGESTSWTSLATDPSTGEIRGADFRVFVMTGDEYRDILISWRDYFTDMQERGTFETAVDAAAWLLSIQYRLDTLAKELGAVCPRRVEKEQNVTVTVIFNEATDNWTCG